MFLISQEVFAQQLFNDGAALLNETKRYACFFFLLSYSGSNMKYSSYLHVALLFKDMDMHCLEINHNTSTLTKWKSCNWLKKTSCHDVGE